MSDEQSWCERRQIIDVPVEQVVQVPVHVPQIQTVQRPVHVPHVVDQYHWLQRARLMSTRSVKATFVFDGKRLSESFSRL